MIEEVGMVVKEEGGKVAIFKEEKIEEEKIEKLEEETEEEKVDAEVITQQEEEDVVMEEYRTIW